MQKPTIGRIVTYFTTRGEGLEPEARPAIITAVFGDECVNLHVFGTPLDEKLESQGSYPTSVMLLGENLPAEPRRWVWPVKV